MQEANQGLYHKKKITPIKKVCNRFLKNKHVYYSKFFGTNSCTIQASYYLVLRFKPLLLTSSFNLVWHGIGKQEKCSSLEAPRGNFYKTSRVSN